MSYDRNRFANILSLVSSSGFDILQRRFPQTAVLRVDAAKVDEHLSAVAGSVDVVVSGLPILCFDALKKSAILSGAFSLLRPGGRFHQFTYLGRCPVGRRMLSNLGLRASLIGVSPINVPPAFVYRLQRLADEPTRPPFTP